MIRGFVKAKGSLANPKIRYKIKHREREDTEKNRKVLKI